jgi:hypothetical protein
VIENLQSVLYKTLGAVRRLLRYSDMFKRFSARYDSGVAEVAQLVSRTILQEKRDWHGGKVLLSARFGGAQVRSRVCRF